MSISRDKLKKLWDSIPPVACGLPCGECCGPAPMTEKEKIIIDEWCEENGVKIPSRSPDGITCPALFKHEAGRVTNCLIYPVRPIACRIYGTIHTLTCDKKIPIPQMSYEYQQLLAWYHRECKHHKKFYLLGFTTEQFKDIQAVGKLNLYKKIASMKGEAIRNA